MYFINSKKANIVEEKAVVGWDQQLEMRPDKQ